MRSFALVTLTMIATGAALAQDVLADVAQRAEAALTAVGKQLPTSFPEEIHDTVQRGFKARLVRI